jgi:hypothetical protein
MVHTFHVGPEYDPDLDPKQSKKSDPDPEKIILNPQHCFLYLFLNIHIHTEALIHIHSYVTFDETPGFLHRCR